MAIDKVEDNVVSRLSSAISDTSEELTVDEDFSGMTVPDEAYLLIGNSNDFQPDNDGSHPTGEVVKYNTFKDNGDGTMTFGAISDNPLTRGVGNTTAQSWSSGTNVGLALTAKYYNIFLDAISPRDAGNYIFQNIYALTGGLSSPPDNPSSGWIYPDDGTNTEIGKPNLRIYDGNNWNDMAYGFEIFSGSHSDLSNVNSDDHHDPANLSWNDLAIDQTDVDHSHLSGVGANDHHDPANQDVDSVDGYDIQKNGTDGSGIINFKTS